jgi:hypothetical protein
MSVWRRKALALFPDYRHEIQARDFTIYSLFMLHVFPALRAAYEAGNTDRLQPVYSFAEWCLRQKAKDIWNAAGVCFYEHLFDLSKRDWPWIVPWLSQYAVDSCSGLWAWRLTTEEYEHLRELLAKMNLFAPPLQPT